MGQVEFPLVAVIDIGKFVANVFADPSYIGETVGAVSSNHTISEIAETFTEVLGKPVTYNEMTTSEFAALGFPFAGEAPALQINEQHARPVPVLLNRGYLLGSFSSSRYPRVKSRVVCIGPA